ncbi:hypothetical protein [Nocardia lasii]|uniref:Uncharacterized protein n=1 Tax=Nocardia lasii TaxID=1616107 RepID=A0ABW1JP69_9NOCA
MSERTGPSEGWIALVDDLSFPMFAGVVPLLRFPAVCVPHGAPAVEYSESQHFFSYSSLHDDLLEHTIGNYFFRTRAPKDSQPFSSRHREWPDARLRCAWPLCEQCRRRYRRFVSARRTCLWVAFAAFAQFGVLIAFFAEESQGSGLVLSLAIFLVGAAIAGTVAMGFGRRAVDVGTLRITEDRGLAVVTAHPNFVTALDAAHRRYVGDDSAG